MTFNHSWAVVVDDGHVSVLSKNILGNERHNVNMEGANAYLEEALAKRRFSALMLVGAPDDLNHFRNILNAPVRNRVVAEVIRPNHTPECLDEHIEGMCA